MPHHSDIPTLEARVRKNLEELDAIWRRASNPSPQTEKEQGCCLHPASCGVWNGRCIHRDAWLEAKRLAERESPAVPVERLYERPILGDENGLPESPERAKGGERRSERIIREMQESDRSGHERGSFGRSRGRELGRSL